MNDTRRRTDHHHRGTTTNITRAALAVVGLAVAACGDDVSTVSGGDLGEWVEAADDAPPCADMFAPGRLVADVIADVETDGLCTDGDETMMNVRVSWGCLDGAEVHQVSDWGWGRDGDVWQGPDVPELYADCVLPGTDAQHP